MRQIDADAVFPWYVETFSEKNIGERAIQPNEIRFSMNDIRDNLDNSPTIDAEPVRQMETANLTVPIIIDRKDSEESLAQLVKAQTQQWIPVSERLPEMPGWYLISKVDAVFDAYFSFDEGWEIESIEGFHPVENVLAWMPLPEPYHGIGAKMDGGDDDADGA